jgi:hypothetical protein
MNQLGDKMCHTQNIKISGDGAKMSRNTGFVVLSFSILSEGDKVMSTKGTENTLKYFYQLKLTN